MEDRRKMVQDLLILPGMEAVNRIVDLDDPHRFVQKLSRVDFFWLIKRIGADDALPLLKLATVAQWQYLLDMDLWKRDRFDMEEASAWIERLLQADPERLVRWLLSEENPLAYLYLAQNIHVEIKRGDELYELADGYSTFDNVFYIRVMDKEHGDMILRLLQQVASQDYDRYQSLLLGLAGFTHSDMEEGMYRMRNVRLAEDGFLPYEEAIGVYSHLSPENVKPGESPHSLPAPAVQEMADFIPLAPIIHVHETNLLSVSLERIEDPVFLDRIGLEFAGLCNQLFSADGIKVEDNKDLIRVCRKAAGYIHLGLTRLSGGDMNLSETYLKNHALISLFRVGFGMALELKWEAERWLKGSWFARHGLKPLFWGRPWGGTLVGILQKRPLFFTGFEKEEEYRDFKQVSELEDCRLIVHRLMDLDRLLDTVSTNHPLERDRIRDPLLTFHPLVFNFWARHVLGVEPGFASLALEEVRDFFRIIRGAAQKPPFSKSEFKSVFIRDMMALAAYTEHEAASRLEETLSILWEGFLDEYAWVATADVDDRFSKFILIRPSSS